jgi:hypothetical protein
MEDGMSNKGETMQNVLGNMRNATYYKTTRELTNEDCPWFDKDFVILKGIIVREFTRPTYGSIDSGIAITFDLVGGDYPFLELPLDAIQQIDYIS